MQNPQCDTQTSARDRARAAALTYQQRQQAQTEARAQKWVQWLLSRIDRAAQRGKRKLELHSRFVVWSSWWLVCLFCSCICLVPTIIDAPLREAIKDQLQALGFDVTDSGDCCYPDTGLIITW